MALKLLLLLLVVAVVLWLLTAKRRRKPPPSADQRRQPGEQAWMLECAHCGVHLPQAEALTDAAGRPYCSEAHQLAGPR